MTLLKSKFSAFFAFAAVCFCTPAWGLSQKEFMDLCLNGDALQVAAALKDEGISVGKADAKGNTPLMMAAQAKGKAADPDKIKLLVNAGSDVNAANKDNLRALAVAAQDSDNPEIIVALVAAGAELQERGSRGWTPLSFAAARNPRPEITAALIDLGADLAAADNSGATPFMLAARAGNAFEVLITLLDEGADPTVTGANKKTAWSYIENSRKYAPEQLSTLKERTRQKNAPAPMGPERFAQLCRRGTARRVGLYLEARTDPNAPVDGLTPLMWAAQYNAHPDVVGVLMKWGARENARDGRGRTALILAASANGNPKVLSALLAHGARVDYRDVDGKTALDYAQANPAFAAEDLQLLASIAASVNEAEERGIQIGAERQKSAGGAADDPRIAPLYKKMAADQHEILRLTTATAELRKKADLATQTAQNAEKQLQASHEQTAQQNALIRRLTDNLTALQASQRKDLELNRGNIDTLTALWQSEMQKNLKLVEENTLNFQRQKGEIDALVARLQVAEARSDQLAEEK
ncbi:ankyrin repeat domain-containing protein, partial [Pyramidobacter porci]